VLIDATAVPADRGGVGRYVDCLVAALEADGAAPMVVCQPRDAELYAALAPHADVLPAMERLVARTARLTWEQTRLPWLVRRARVDVLHCPHYTMPLARQGATVVTLHDATFFTDPRVHSPVKARFFRAWTRTSLRRADVCVVPSESTARELGRVVGAGVERLHVVHHGVDADRFHPPSPEEVAAVRRRLRLAGSPYVAFLGALEPRKNVLTLLRAYCSLPAEFRERYPLVLVGGWGWNSADVADYLDRQGRPRDVRHLGYFPEKHLAVLYNGARALLMPPPQ